MVHAEGYDQIKFMTDELEREGKTHSYYHAVSRPELVEREATHRAISHAELIGIPIMIVHVSGREAMEQIEWARKRGLKIYAETCPQYLVLTADDLKGLNMDMTGAKYVCSPPPRDRASQEAMWRGLETGMFETFSSDHCPFRYDDVAGKNHPKARTSFRWVPNGIPGVAARLPILFSEGRQEGAHLALPVRRADRDQPRQDVWALPAQGLDHGRRRRRHRDLGRRPQGEADERIDAPRRRLHAL